MQVRKLYRKQHIQKQRFKKEEKWKVKSSWMKGEDKTEDAEISSALHTSNESPELRQQNSREAGDWQESSNTESQFVSAEDDERIPDSTSNEMLLRRKPL